MKWGPVSIPGGGEGGPPTVADFDNDGQPEIGVAGVTNYAVFETDGSLKWAATIQDGSGHTGSSVFDFDDDGAAEVVYRDELNLRVYKGSTGEVLFETPMSSCTWLEYVIVADVDNDAHAELVAVANDNCGFGPQRGVFVFGSDTWVPTRKIWNQHTYHITNVNEDGTIPRVEQNNWLIPRLNNFRLNTFSRGDRGAMDLTVEVTHRLPANGYTIDPTSVSPTAQSVLASEVRWTGQRLFNETAPLQFQLSGQVTNMAPGEVRQISLGTEVKALLSGELAPPEAFDLATADLIKFPLNPPHAAEIVWNIDTQNGVATQLNNSDPSIVLSRQTLDFGEFQGTIRIDGGDDDFIGVVFGYQDEGHFYLADWSAGNDTGFAVRVVNNPQKPATSPDFYLEPAGSQSEVLQILFMDKSVRWQPGIDYRFTIRRQPGGFAIAVEDGTRMLISTFVQDTTYGDGRVGLYSYSQAGSRFSNFSIRRPVGLSTTVPLPPLTIVAAHIIDLDPISQKVLAGESTTYEVLVTNPLTSQETFTLSTAGLAGLSVDLGSSVVVPAKQTVRIPLRVSVPASASGETRTFSVVAQTASGGRDSVAGQLEITARSDGGGGPPPTVALDTRVVSVALAPEQATAGQGTSVTFDVLVTNAGDETDTYTLIKALPSGFEGIFAEPTVTVLPGLSNARHVQFTITPSPGTPVGATSFAVGVISTVDSAVHDEATGLVTVVGEGVDVTLSPSVGSPSSTFQLTVKNTGQSSDTFDLTLGGPAGITASLNVTNVTLAVGQSQTIPITLGAVNFAVAGDLDLSAVATSRNNTAVKDTATAKVRVGVNKGLSVTLTPTGVELSVPGPAPFLVQVNNLGNTEDEYKAEIIGTTGPITAALSDLNRQATQTVPLFRLPGLSSGGIVLNTTLTAVGEGKVTVKVTSLSDASLTAEVIATVRTLGAGGQNKVPVADAGDDKNVAVGIATQLDGSDSFDPDGDQITYTWTVVSVPTGSQVKTETLEGKTTPKPTFTPDVAGPYVFRLIVNDGKADSVPDEVTITAAKDNVPPNADAGVDLDVQVGAPVTADGSKSADSDNGPQPLTYQWTVLQVPTGSTIQNDSLTDATQAKVSFTPDKPGVYGLRLTLSDGQASDTDEVLITVRAQNVPPTANAGPDQTVTLGKEVQLSGQRSIDPDNAPQPLTYSWRFVSKPATSKLIDADLIGSETVTPKFQPDVTGSYVIELEAFDGAVSSFDTVVIEVIAAVAQDVTILVRITTANERSTLDRATRKVTSTADLTITNISDKVIKVPIQAVFLLTVPEVTMPEANGKTTDNKPFYDVGAKTEIVELKPNEAVTFLIKFVYASTVRFTYTVQVFGVVP